MLQTRSLKTSRDSPLSLSLSLVYYDARTSSHPLSLSPLSSVLFRPRFAPSFEHAAPSFYDDTNDYTSRGDDDFPKQIDDEG